MLSGKQSLWAGQKIHYSWLIIPIRRTLHTEWRSSGIPSRDLSVSSLDVLMRLRYQNVEKHRRKKKTEGQKSN